MNQQSFAATIFAAAFFCVGGCDFSEPLDPTESRVRVVAGQYMRFCNQHAGKGPQDENEFKSFLQQAGQPVLDAAGVGSVDELLVSERDDKPLVVLCGKDTIWLDYLQIVVHETEGLHGQVMVGYRVGDAELITAEALAEATKRKR